jgi:ankyrin repeat protein
MEWASTADAGVWASGDGMSAALVDDGHESDSSLEADEDRAASRASADSPITNDATTQTALAALHIDDNDVVAELHRTVIQDNANELVKLLVGSEIDANSTFTRTERPILHVAASLGAHDCLCYLIRLGADVNKQDSGGRTALHLAARNGHRRIIETLVKQFHADVGIADGDG